MTLTLTLTLEFADNDPQEGVLRRDVTPPHRHDDRVRAESNRAKRGGVCVCARALVLRAAHGRTETSVTNRHSGRMFACVCVFPNFHGWSFPRVALITQETGAARDRACGCRRTHITERRTRVEETAERRTHRMSEPLEYTGCRRARAPTADNQFSDVGSPSGRARGNCI